MMRSSLASLLLLLPLTFACTTSPSATPATSAPAATPAATPAAPATAAAVAGRTLNPVGAFDFTATLPDGSRSNGNFTIAGSPAAYTGWIEREGATGIAIGSIAVDGQTLILGTSVPQGPVTLTLNFTGAEFSGRWAMEGASGAVTGRRR